MSELTEFLLARSREEREAIQRIIDFSSPEGLTYTLAKTIIDQCDATVAIVAHSERIDWEYEPASEADYNEEYLRFLALPYSDHDDYQDDWAPAGDSYRI